MKMILCLLFFAFVLPLQAQTMGSNLGTSWLKISPSTRNAGMGDSMMAAGDPYDAVDLNPALLGLNRGSYLSFSQNFWAQDLSAQHLVFSPGSPGNDGFGFGVNYMNFGNIATYNVVGSVLSSSGGYSPIGLNLYAGYGLGLAPGLRVGLTAHFIYDDIQQNFPDTTGALDAGLYYGLDSLPISFSALLTNFGWNIDQATLPMEIKTAAAYRILGKLSAPTGDFLTLTGETDWFLEDLNYNQFGLGTEYWYKNTIALRAGYQFSNTGNLAGLTGLSLGAGIRYLNWQLDYALITLGELGVANQIGLSLKWGDEPKLTLTPTATMTLTATSTMTFAATLTATPTATAAGPFKEETGKGYNVTKDTITLYSDFKSKEPHVKDVELLDEVASVLKADIYEKVSIDGYTDNRGPQSLNDKLSKARAERVREFLLQKGAPEISIVWARGHGSDDPAADNATPEGQALNRRVVIHIVLLAPPTYTPTIAASNLVTQTPTVEVMLSPVSSAITAQTQVVTGTPTMMVSNTPTLGLTPSVMATLGTETPVTTMVTPQTTPAVSGVSITGWWGDSFDAETVYSKLTSELVPSLATQGQMAQLGQDQKLFFSTAQQQGVDHSRLSQMKSGYYTAVAKSLVGLDRTKDAGYYLNLALSSQKDNAQALALQQQIQAAAPAQP